MTSHTDPQIQSCLHWSATGYLAGGAPQVLIFRIA